MATFDVHTKNGTIVDRTRVLRHPHQVGARVAGVAEVVASL